MIIAVIILAVALAGALVLAGLTTRSALQSRDDLIGAVKLYQDMRNQADGYRVDRDAWKVKHDEAQHTADDALQALALARTNRNEAQREAMEHAVAKIKTLGIADAAVVLDGLLSQAILPPDAPRDPAAASHDPGDEDTVRTPPVTEPH